MLYNRMSMLPMDHTDALAAQMMRFDAELDHFNSTVMFMLASFELAALSGMVPKNKPEWGEVTLFRATVYGNIDELEEELEALQDVVDQLCKREESEAKHAHNLREQLHNCYEPTTFVQLSDELTYLHEDMIIDVAKMTKRLTELSEKTSNVLLGLELEEDALSSLLESHHGTVR